MSKQRRVIGVLMLLVLAGISAATGEWWMLWSGLIASVTVLVLKPLQNWYERGSAAQKKVLLILNQVIAVAGLGLLVWLAASLDLTGAAASAWLPWLLVAVVPVALFASGIFAWRSLDPGSGGPG